MSKYPSCYVRPTSRLVRYNLQRQEHVTSTQENVGVLCALLRGNKGFHVLQQLQREFRLLITSSVMFHKHD